MITIQILISILMWMYCRGWEQLEATCNPNLREPKAVWSVEEITDNRCKS